MNEIEEVIEIERERETLGKRSKSHFGYDRCKSLGKRIKFAIDNPIFKCRCRNFGQK
jgi:hypothetical protein